MIFKIQVTFLVWGIAICGSEHRGPRSSPLVLPDEEEVGRTIVGVIRSTDSLSAGTHAKDELKPIVFGEKASYRVTESPKCFYEEGEQGFCTNDSEYDEQIQRKFSELLENSPINNIISDVLNETIVPEVTLRNRFGFTTEMSLCLSTETIIYPKRGQTSNSEWVFILNQGSVQQGVRVEKCVRLNTPCHLGGGPVEHTICRQKYIYKKMLTMDQSGNNIVSESVYMPSCCVCYVSSDFVSTRIRKNTGLVRTEGDEKK